MTLEGKVAVTFAAGGAVGCAVSKALAREGAQVFLSAHSSEDAERVAVEIAADGGQATGPRLDATDESAVATFVDRVAGEAGRIDVVFNAVGLQAVGHGQIAPSLELPLDAFRLYMNTVVGSQFLTARSAARHMAAAGSGVVIFLSATLARGVAPFIAGESAAFAAIEGLTRCLATEWGPMGIRVVCVRSGGMTDSPRIQEAFGAFAGLMGIPRDSFAEAARERAPLGRMPTLRQTADIVSFLASERAGSVTGAVINASCGEVLD